MAIVKMNKFTLLAFEDQKKLLLEKLQSFENVEFSDLNKEDISELNHLKRDNSSIEISEIQGELSKVKYVIELLSTFSEKTNILKSLKEGKTSYSYDVLEQTAKTSKWNEAYKELKEKDNKANTNKNYIGNLESKIEELKPWSNLDVDIVKIKNLTYSKIIFCEIPQDNAELFRVNLKENVANCYLEKVSTIGRTTYSMVIAHKDDLAKVEQLLKFYNSSKVDIRCDGVPSDVIKDYNSTIKSITSENETIKQSLKVYLSKLEEYKVVCEYYNCLLARLNSTSNFLRSNNIVAMEGYYPTELNEDLIKMLNNVLGNNYYLESEAADGDEVPVKLSNNSIVESFESVTAMYSVPKYKEIDPTPLLTPFYIFFFGMMLSDAGYGFLILIGTIIALVAFNLDDDMKKTMRMFCLLGISTIFWGAMYGSYFGDFIPIPPIWMKPDSNVALLMIVSIGMGLIQILFGLGIKAYLQIRSKDYFGAFSDVFLWYITLIGGIIWLVGGFGVDVPSIISTIAKYATIAGMIGIVLTNGRDAKSIGGKLASGLYALYGITSYVGDLVSYTRLAALGLATGFIAYAFNVMVDLVSTSWITVIFGVLIFVVGHIFNLFINALGSYVHTLRLQYLEFFGKFYEGGGKPFEPLKYDLKYFKILKEDN